MSWIAETFNADFFSLSGNALLISVVIGLACPLIGVYLVLRRLIFLGVALPAISSAGVALALSLHVWFGHYEEAHGTEEQGYALIGSIAMTLAAIVFLAYAERRGRGLVEGRIGTAYILATGGSLLLLAKCPAAERGWLNLFKGEIVAINDSELQVTFTILVIVLLLLATFRKAFMLVSFDPELALVQRTPVLAWNTFLYLLIGVAIAVVVVQVGPLMAFGFLILPPLIVHHLARNMRQFFLFSSLLGGLAAAAGFVVAYLFDLPVGPTDVSILGAVYGWVMLYDRIRQFRTRKFSKTVDA